MTFRELDELSDSLRRAVMAPDGVTDVARSLQLCQSAVWIGVAVRQLAEAGLLELEFQRRCWPVRLHWLSERQDDPDWDDFENLYELRASRADQLTTLRLCGFFVQGSLLEPVLDKRGRPLGIYFTSTLTRRDRLYFLEWRQLEQLVDAVCHELGVSGVITPT